MILVHNEETVRGRQAHHNTARPHQGIAQHVPDDEPGAPCATVTDFGIQQIRRKPVLGGLINEYARRLTTEDLQVTCTILFSSGTGMTFTAMSIPAVRPTMPPDGSLPPSQP
jgi:hypothetical protein